jgi:hypothetical protein
MCKVRYSESTASVNSSVRYATAKAMKMLKQTTKLLRAMKVNATMPYTIHTDAHE